jgi:hypothetical protein
MYYRIGGASAEHEASIRWICREEGCVRLRSDMITNCLVNLQLQPLPCDFSRSTTLNPSKLTIVIIEQYLNEQR